MFFSLYLHCILNSVFDKTPLKICFKKAGYYLNYFLHFLFFFNTIVSNNCSVKHKHTAILRLQWYLQAENAYFRNVPTACDHHDCLS